MSATLTIEPRPDLGDRVKEYVLDCAHGTTRGLAVDGRVKMTDNDIVQVILDRHDLEEQCGCTAELRRRYGQRSAPASEFSSRFSPLAGAVPRRRAVKADA